MSDVVICGGCRQTTQRRDARGWWRMEQSPSTSKGVGVTYDFCSVECASDLLRGGVGRLSRREYPRYV